MSNEQNNQMSMFEFIEQNTSNEEWEQIHKDNDNSDVDNSQAEQVDRVAESD